MGIVPYHRSRREAPLVAAFWRREAEPADPLTYDPSVPRNRHQADDNWRCLTCRPRRGAASSLGSGDRESKGIHGFDSLDARSRPFNMVPAELHELSYAAGLAPLRHCFGDAEVGKSFIAANVAASLSRDPRFETTAIDLDLSRASLTGIFKISSSKVSISFYLEEERQADIPTAVCA